MRRGVRVLWLMPRHRRNGIATASPAVDLLWEKRVIGDVSDDYGLPPRRRSSHVA